MRFFVVDGLSMESTGGNYFLAASAGWWGSFGLVSGRTGFASLPHSGNGGTLHSFLILGRIGTRAM